MLYSHPTVGDFMKKILLTLWVALAVGAPAVFAEEDEDVMPVKSALTSSDRLVDIETRRSASKMDDLESRFRDLERSQRSLEERIRNLERSVSDLKRRNT